MAGGSRSRVIANGCCARANAYANNCSIRGAV